MEKIAILHVSKLLLFSLIHQFMLFINKDLYVTVWNMSAGVSVPNTNSGSNQAHGPKHEMGVLYHVSHNLDIY